MDKKSKCHQEKCSKTENYNLHNAHSSKTECGSELTTTPKDCGGSSAKNCK